MSNKADPAVPDSYQSSNTTSSAPPQYTASPQYTPYAQPISSSSSSPYPQSGYPGASPSQAQPQGPPPQSIPQGQTAPFMNAGPSQMTYGTVPGVVVVGPPTGMYSEYPPFPVSTTCPNCHQVMVTRTTKEPGLIAWLSCAGLALVGCWLGCCLIPFCVDGLQDTTHYCSNCNVVIGAHRSNC